MKLLGTPFGYPNEPAALSDDDLHLRLCSAEAVAVVRIVERHASLDRRRFVVRLHGLSGQAPTRHQALGDRGPLHLETITFARPGGSAKLADESTDVLASTRFLRCSLDGEDILGLRAYDEGPRRREPRACSFRSWVTAHRR